MFLLDLCCIAGDTVSLIVHLLTGVSMANTVSDGWQETVQLLEEEVATRGPLSQRALEVLQLTQEVEVWGNGGPTLFHKPNKGINRTWIRTTSVPQLTL